MSRRYYISATDFGSGEANLANPRWNVYRWNGREPWGHIASVRVAGPFWTDTEARAWIASKERDEARRKRRVALFVLVGVPLVLFILWLFVHPSHAQNIDITQLIVPGHRIGRVHLGQSLAEVTVVDRDQEIYVAYIRGRAATLFTPWAGAFSTQAGIGVGSPYHHILKVFGAGRRLDETAIPGTTAKWGCLWYDDRGIGFTMLYTDRGSSATGVWIYPIGMKALHIPVEWNCPNR